MEDNNFIEVIKENKVKIIILLVCIIISIVLMIVKNNMSEKSENVDNPDSAAEVLAGFYYENLLYPYIEKNNSDYLDYLESVSESGIEIELRTLTSNVSDVNMDVFIGDKYTCVFPDSYVKIFPTADYGKEDYRVETYLNCSETVVVSEENQGEE